VSAGEEYDAVVEKVEGLRSFEARADYFKDLTNESFKAAVDKTKHRSFYEIWDRVRCKRNEFIHGNPYAINAPIAALAVQLSKDAIPMFARLQNIYAVRAVQSDEGQREEGM